MNSIGRVPCLSSSPSRVELLSRECGAAELCKRMGLSSVHPACRTLNLPLAGFNTPAGFPSPAADFLVERVDLAQRFDLDKPYVFLGRVSGDSMLGRGIDTGDLLVINRNITPQHGHVVVAVIDNELTCKMLYKSKGVTKLVAANPSYPDIIPRDAQELTVWGVVTSVVKDLLA